MRNLRTRIFASPQNAVATLAADLATLTPGQEALVVVPSNSLRHGLIYKLCQIQSAWVGVRVVTLQGLAMEVLARAGQQLPMADALLPVVVARAVSQGSFFSLGGFSQLAQVGPLVRTVRDLLDAGFTEAHLEACIEALNGAGLGESALARGREVLILAASVASGMADGQLFRRSDALVRATALLANPPHDVLTAERIIVYGFADVTGLVGDFLQALAEHRGVYVYLVTPPDPVDERRVAGGRFLQRLALRFGLTLEGASPPPGAASRVELWRAPGLEAEIRGVGEEIALFLEEGGKPEDVAVVARDLGPYRSGITRIFAELGVPFSGEGEAIGQHPRSAFLNAFVAVLAKGKDALMDDFCELLGSQPGKGRLAWELQRRAAPAAATLGLVASALEEADTGEVGELLRGLRGFLQGLPQEATAETWRDQTWRFAGLTLFDDQTRRELHQASRELAQELGAIMLHRQEWCFLLKEKLGELLAVPLGGRGAGVAVLSVMEARFRSFQRIYLLGMVRDAFPRLAQDDPFLPEVARQQLECVLPDIPRATRSGDEERYLFGLLLTSAPEVKLCWPCWDDAGREQAPSPYLDELLAVKPELAVRGLPAALSAKQNPRWASASHWAKIAGLQGHRRAWQELLAMALSPHQGLLPTNLVPSQVAEARNAILAEWDPPPWQERASPSPYLGFLGSLEQEKLPEPTVTFWEQYAQCPWYTWLARVLKIQSWALDFEATPALVGSLVHGVLRRIIQESFPDASKDWAARLGQGNRRVLWPSHQRLKELCGQEAEKMLEKEQVPPWPGLMMFLVQAAMPYLARAKELLFPNGEGEFVAAEAWERVRLGEREVSFQFDAAFCEAGKVVFLDYKTGKASRFRPGRAGVLAQVRQGLLLQAACYAASRQGEGRYVFLNPSWEGEPMEKVPYTPDLEENLRVTLELFSSAAEKGIFFPRLWDPVQDREPNACRTCSMRLACSRGESAARGRLISWALQHKPGVASNAGVGGQVFWLGQLGEEQA